MRTYKHDPDTHVITRHQQGDPLKFIACAPHENVGYSAWMILLDSYDQRTAAMHWRQMAVDFRERLNPKTHWQITVGDAEHVGELDSWLALQREKVSAP